MVRQGDRITGLNFAETIVGIPQIIQELEVVEKKEDYQFPDEEGETFDMGQIRYTLGEIIGQGGMAVVRIATRMFIGEQGTERTVIPGVVAVKRAYGLDRRNKQAVKKEANLNMGLSYQQILIPIGYGEYKGRPTLVMPYVASDLEKIIRSHNLEPNDNVPDELQEMPEYLTHYGTQEYTGSDGVKRIPDKFVGYFMYMIARTLHHLHKDTGIIHRDISPGNILVQPSTGAIYLADFGVAKQKGEKNTIVAFKLQYSSPEGFFDAEYIDQRTDLYTLGAVAYKMLTGITPNDVFTDPDSAEDTEDHWKKHITELLLMFETPLVPPHEIVTGIDPRLSAMVCKLLATKPDDRYQSAADLIRDVRAYIHDGPGPTTDGLSAYLRIMNEGIESYETEDLLHAMEELKFLPRQQKKGLSKLLFWKKGDPLIQQHYFLTDEARIKLGDHVNPAREYVPTRS